MCHAFACNKSQVKLNHFGQIIEDVIIVEKFWLLFYKSNYTIFRNHKLNLYVNTKYESYN